MTPSARRRRLAATWCMPTVSPSTSSRHLALALVPSSRVDSRSRIRPLTSATLSLIRCTSAASRGPAYSCRQYWLRQRVKNIIMALSSVVVRAENLLEKALVFPLTSTTRRCPCSPSAAAISASAP